MSGSMPALPMGADSAMTLIPTKRSELVEIAGQLGEIRGSGARHMPGEGALVAVPRQSGFASKYFFSPGYTALSWSSFRSARAMRMDGGGIQTAGIKEEFISFTS
jgi:hypothetical protein